MERLNDEWIDIVSFLEPIDVLASLNGVSRAVQYIVEGCYVSSQQLSTFYHHDQNFNLEKLKVYYYDWKSDSSSMGEEENNSKCLNRVNDDNAEERILIMKNKLCIVRYYLVGFAAKFKQQTINSELKLFEFYQKQFENYWNKKRDQDLNVSTSKRFIKYAIIGNKKVGKSRYFRSFSSGIYSPHLLPNIGADFIVRGYEFLNFKLKHQVWHGSILNYAQTTGIVAKSFLNSTSYLAFSFSIDNRNSFMDITKYWIPLWKQFAPDTVGILLGFYPREEKFKRQVTQKEAIELARKSFNSVYIEINAAQMNNINLPSIFIHLECIYSNSWQILEESIPSSKTQQPKAEIDKSWCSLQ